MVPSVDSVDAIKNKGTGRFSNSESTRRCFSSTFHTNFRW